MLDTCKIIYDVTSWRYA